MDLLTQFYVTLFLMGASFGIGYWIGKDGISGIEADISNIKTDISTLSATKVTKPVVVATTTPSTTITPSEAVTLSPVTVA